MKQTNRAILEMSRAPQAPLLICSKMLQSYNNIEIKFDLPILSRILASRHSIHLLRVSKNLQLFKKITTTPPRFSHSLSISLCLIAKLIFVQALVIYHKESIGVMRSN